MSSKERTKRISRLAMLTALSVVLVALIRFPIFPAAPYLTYDPADVPILVAAFMYGPWHGVAVTAIVSVLQGLTVSADGGPIGIIMHILATSAFCLTAGYIYKAKRTLKGAITGLVFGAIAMSLVMAGCNVVLTPLYTGLPRSEVINMLVPIVIPFNLIKAGLNSVVTFLIYKPVERLFDIRKDKEAKKKV
ncbi:MAG: ECF transporter S component [Oscillospiraceae bacterium]